MRVSVIICTLGRPADVARVVGCLAAQTHRDAEVLVVAPADLSVEARANLTASAAGAARVVAAPRGLTRQRNAGLREARGDVLVFLDDDVTVGRDFLARAAGLFARPDFADVGGLTGYDAHNWPEAVPTRWRLRRLLRTVPSLAAGAADRLGRNVPHAFAPDDAACREVGWLGGFCMLYRREAVVGLWFDEALPTYGGEDRDFSIAVGRRWRLVMCGELRLWHLSAPGGRASAVRRSYECGFGAGRGFAKHGRGLGDVARLVQYAAGELVIDLLAWVRRPVGANAVAAFARLRGVVSGYRSWRSRRPAPSEVW